MITRLKTRISPKDNRTFAFADMEDFTGKVEVVLWAEVFESVRHLVETDSMVLIRGELKWDEERSSHKLTATKVLSLAEAREKLTKSVHVRLRTTGLQPEQLDRYQSLCEDFPGKCQLVFHLEAPQQEPVTVLSDRFPIRPDAECFGRLIELAGSENVRLSAKTYA